MAGTGNGNGNGGFPSWLKRDFFILAGGAGALIWIGSLQSQIMHNTERVAAIEARGSPGAAALAAKVDLLKDRIDEMHDDIMKLHQGNKL